MKIGILTMHKVLNYGSALQAFALLHYIQSLGYDVELIDYIFPHKQKLSIVRRVIRGAKSVLSGRYNMQNKFQKFYNDFYKCSKITYNSPAELVSADLDYDIFITGSDQVWNPIHIKDDYSFFLPFVPENKLKYSYASSFSVSSLPNERKSIVKELLLKYDKVSVREKSSLDIVKDLTGITPEYVCDPTLLITKEEWRQITADCTFNIEKPYILAYILKYAYNPYPDILNIIKKIRNELDVPVVFLDGPKLDIKNVININNIAPLQFVNLINNAKYVITTSFHGTAFSLNFEKPFVSVIKNRSGFDTRMIDLLETVNADRAIIYNEDFNIDLDFTYSEISVNLNRFRDKSIEYLNSILKH